MKKIKNVLFIIVLIATILLPVKVMAEAVAAVEWDGVFTNGQKVATDNYASTFTNVGKSNSESTSMAKIPCGEEGVLCFGGDGLFFNLVKYDYKTKKEEYVGKTVLYYSGGFINSFHTVYNKYPTQEKMSGPTWEGMLTYTYTDAAVFSTYPRSSITYYPRGNTGVGESQIKVIEDPNLKRDDSGYVNYVHGKLNEIVLAAAKKNPLQPMVEVANLFDYGEEMKKPENLTNLNKFYIVVDVAERKIGTSPNAWAQGHNTADATPEICTGTGCSVKWITTEIFADQWVKAKCGISGSEVDCVGFDSYNEVDKAICKGLNTSSGDTTYCRKAQSHTYGLENDPLEGKCEKSEQGTPATDSATCEALLSKTKDEITWCLNTPKSVTNTDIKFYCEFSPKIMWENKNKCDSSCYKIVTDEWDDPISGITHKQNVKVTGTCKESKTITTTTTDYHIDYVCRYDYESWKVTGNVSIPLGKGMKQKYKRAEIYFTYSTSVRRVRDTGSVRLSLSLLEKADKENAKKVKDKDGNVIEGKYEYYIGPNAKESLAGIKDSNKYQLLPLSKYNALNVTKSDVLSNKYTLGFSVVWLPELFPECEECTSISNQNQKLICAENYCDNKIGYQEDWSVNKEKKECIVKTCNYQPNFKGCSGFDYSTINTGSDYLEECIGKWCSGSSSTEDINKPKPIDQKNYVNIACVEKTNKISFKGVENKVVIPGIGVDLSTSVARSKSCYVWIDIEAWKLDYASVHSRDTVCMDDNCTKTESTRNLLLKILDDYNDKTHFKEKDGIIIDTISSMVDTRERAVAVKWADLNINTKNKDGTNRTTVNTKVQEDVNNSKVTDSNLSLVKTEEQVKTILTAMEEKDTTQMIAKLTSKPKKVNAYSSQSISNETFQFEKTCVTQDGKGETYKANDQGVCYKNQSKDAGKNVFYTSLKGINSKYEIDMDSNVEVGVDQKIPETNSTSNSGTNPVCARSSKGGDLNIPVPNNQPCDSKIKCKITIKPNGTTEIYEGAIYNGSDGVNAQMTFDGDITKETITGYKVFVDANENQLSNVNGEKNDNIDIKAKSLAGTETHVVECRATTSSGKTICGSKTIKLSNCGGTKCTITKKSDNEYVVDVHGTNAMAVYISTGVNPIENFRIYKNKAGIYLFTLQDVTTTENKTTITAKVVDNAGTSCCIYGNKMTSCKLWNKDEDKTYGEAYNWCKTNFKDDPNKYDDEIECADDCAPCPFVDSCDEGALNKITEWCSAKFKNSEVKDATNHCVNRCYKRSCLPDNVVYRPINISDPFPNSSESTTNPGKRIIGANWVGYIKHILDDEDDSTTLTGPNAGTEVEYIIDLTPADIRKIREDNARKREKEKTDTYTDLVYSKDIKDTYKGSYRSSFIHDEDKENGGFASIFSKVMY